MTKDQADQIVKLLHQIAAAQLGMIDSLAAMRLHQVSTIAQNENERLEAKREEQRIKQAFDRRHHDQDRRTMAQLLKEVKT